jgi:hypothetical protein
MPIRDEAAYIGRSVRSVLALGLERSEGDVIIRVDGATAWCHRIT